jgi:glycosyltransferase involved in cell wall biosynthesis
LLVTVHDLVWRLFPSGLKFWGRFFQRTGLAIAAREAQAVVAVSQATRRDLAGLAPGLAPRVEVIPLAAEEPAAGLAEAEIAAVLRRYDLPAGYLLALGTLEPRKNHARLLQAYAALPAARRAPHPLVVAGAPGWNTPDLPAFAARLGLAGQVRWLGYVPEADRQALLQGALAVLYVSVYEGFGLPILEALAGGVPVLTSDLASMPEVAGEAALLVDPYDVGAITAALNRLLTEPGLRRALAEKGPAQARQFSFERMARAYHALYHRLCISP